MESFLFDAQAAIRSVARANVTASRAQPAPAAPAVSDIADDLTRREISNARHHLFHDGGHRA